jgi:two-component system, cell cycle sensor histidine kinase and response regulator CckA
MPDSTEPLQDEPADAADAAAGAPKGFDYLQIAFWMALAISAGAAGMALTWREAVGPAGAALVIALGAMGLLLTLWLVRGAGRKLGLFPDRGAAEAAAHAQANRKVAWLEALGEPALISDRHGATVSANTSYVDLASVAHDLGEPTHAPSVDRLFGASPGMAAPIFRLSKAVKAGASRTELLPAILLGDSVSPVQYEASVAPLSRTRALWRMRRVEQMSASGAGSSVDPRALYIEDAPVGFFSARRDGRVIYVNQTLRQMLGLPEEPAGLRLDDIMRPEGLRLLKREVRGAASQRAEVVMRARDGVELPATLITTWAGKGADAVTRSVVHVADAADQAARRTMPEGDTTTYPSLAATVTDSMFADAPFGMVHLSGDSVETATMLDTNRALTEMTGGRAHPGGRFADLFVADQGPGVLAEQLGGAIDAPANLKLAGDTHKSAEVFVALDRNGRPSAAYVIDVTEKKLLEQRLAQSEKLQAIGKLAGEIAHDFNNLLQGIILNVNRLQIRHPPGDPTFFELRAIQELASRGAELVRMILAWSRQQVFRKEVIDVSQLIGDYFVLLRDIIDERIKLDIVHGRDLPRIKADRHQLETALTNLCTNARDAMIEKNSGGRLTIRTSRADASVARADGFTHAKDGDYALIEVIDDGAGIPPEILDKIFEPFFTTKAPGAGTGFGLATVYGIVKQSDGYIYPVSKLGRGTTFKVFLPAWLGAEDELEQPAPAMLSSPEPSTRSASDNDVSGRGRILLVEDEDSVRGIATQLLSSFGYQVMEASDGEQALEIIRNHAGSIDLLISDVVMPGMDGPALLRAARPWLTHTRVMFISGYAERDLAKTLEEERTISFLPKPFTLRQLAERVKQELKEKNKERDAA